MQECDLEYWYRVNEHRYASVNEFGETENSYTELSLDRYPVIKHTPKGVWIARYYDKKFILKSAKKQWACPTEEQAKASYVARKKRQIKILSNKLNEVRVFLAQLEQNRITRSNAA